ncbi:hypothetical protein [Pseudomonas sp. P9(2020)]|uniref:hypothetical protein n=1 Tax=Pseudomonas sp. P9(2020) TaxID=2763316 RepID=UPI001B329180|nr:hypothetical protein [Pseudomonas sp. P9(2020)]MBP5947951.1 hypothetical protein [Pseudomonas sp. P9(2020)]
MNGSLTQAVPMQKNAADAEVQGWEPGWYTDAGNKAGRAHVFDKIAGASRTVRAVCGRVVLHVDLKCQSASSSNCVSCSSEHSNDCP